MLSLPAVKMAFAKKTPGFAAGRSSESIAA
jgi:hypothetical protein